MLKEAELSNPNSCINKAGEGEMVFVLRAKDPVSPGLIEEWIQRRIDTGLNGPLDEKIQEAYRCASIMREQKARMPKA